MKKKIQIVIDESRMFGGLYVMDLLKLYDPFFIYNFIRYTMYVQNNLTFAVDKSAVNSQRV